MEDPRDIPISLFDYDLPDDRIARYPLEKRSDSKLLVWKNGGISDSRFDRLPELLPQDAMLVFNDSRVVNARLFFTSQAGGAIEIFCLEPEGEMTQAMQAQGAVKWRCLVGRLRKWKETRLSAVCQGIRLSAAIIERKDDYLVIGFEWTPAEKPFAEVLDLFGSLPIPPYLGRDTEEIDLSRYQTIYARSGASVAAPTAGLHFTPELMDELTRKKVDRLFLQLHVGSGTFKPVKAASMGDHQMHGEWIVVKREALKQLLGFLPGQIIAVGTTSLRALESLYWLGRKVLSDSRAAPQQLEVEQWEPYFIEGPEPGVNEALKGLLMLMEERKLPELWCRTSIIIAPPYRLRVAAGLITNFHQPRSTLLLLVAAVTGENWRKIYGHALANGYRFLSYGDSSLLLR